MSQQNEAVALREIASSTLALLQRCTSALLTKDSSTDPQIPNAPDPFNVLHDAAKLLKAHTTKLSLLMINKPFTPSAVRKIIAEVAGTCFPAMMSAVEICQPEMYGNTMHEEVKFRVRKVLKEYEGMMVEVISRTKEVETGNDAASKKQFKKQQDDSLKSTGVVWEACDALMELKTMGVVGIVVKKAEEYRALLQDAINELKEWSIGEDEGFSEPEYEGDDEQDRIDRMMNTSSKLPADEPELRTTLDMALKKLKLINTLYQAVIKRRLKTLASSPSPAEAPNNTVSPVIASRADGVLNILQNIPDQTDDLASAFYDLDNETSRRLVQDICSSGKEVAELLQKDWQDKEDEFSTWSQKWIDAVDKT